jgi:hypothetical protein
MKSPKALKVIRAKFDCFVVPDSAGITPEDQGSRSGRRGSGGMDFALPVVPMFCAASRGFA